MTRFARLRSNSSVDSASGSFPPELLQRLHGAGVRFSIVAAAGELLTGLGISSWQPGEAQAAAGKCFAAWRAQRGGSGAWDEDQAIKYVKSVLVAHGNSRFQLIGGAVRMDDSKIANRLGFRALGKNGHSEYILVPEMFREVCGPYSEDLVRRVLQKRGVLKGSDARHTTTKRTLPELGRVRCYVIEGSIFGGDDEDEGTNEENKAGMRGSGAHRSKSAFIPPIAAGQERGTSGAQRKSERGTTSAPGH